MRSPNLILLLLPLFLLGCTKEKTKIPQQPAATGFKMEIIKGNNQKDSIGHTLKDSIVIRVTNNNKLLNWGYLSFTGSGCDINTPIEVPVNSGLGFFKWQLGSSIGTQELQVILLDSAHVARDTLKITANAAMPLHGWQPSPCMPYHGVKTFCKLKTGKLFALFLNTNFLFTSNDNGINWHKLPEINGHYQIVDMIAVPDDGIFLLTQSNGLLYSSDAGNTWVPRNNGITNFKLADGISVSPSGKVFAAVHSDGKVYSTIDDGVNWTASNLSIFELPDGRNYFIDNFNTLRVTTNGGASYNYVYAFSATANPRLQFIDDKGYLYVSMSSNYNDFKLYRSTDDGHTFVPVYSAKYVQGTPLGIAQLSEHNGTFYFYAYGSGLIKTNDFKTYTNISTVLTEQSRSYIVTQNDQLVIGLYYGSIYYYLP